MGGLLYCTSCQRETLQDSAANLENDTEKRRNQALRCDDLRNQGASRGEIRQSDFEELNAVKSSEGEGFGEPELEGDGTEKD